MVLVDVAALALGHAGLDLMADVSCSPGLAVTPAALVALLPMAHTLLQLLLGNLLALLRSFALFFLAVLSLVLALAEAGKLDLVIVAASSLPIAFVDEGAFRGVRHPSMLYSSHVHDAVSLTDVLRSDSR